MIWRNGGLEADRSRGGRTKDKANDAGKAKCALAKGQRTIKQPLFLGPCGPSRRAGAHPGKFIRMPFIALYGLLSIQKYQFFSRLLLATVPRSKTNF